MPCLNPVTFEPLMNTVKFKPKSFVQWDDVLAWCKDNVGKELEIWNYTGPEMQMPTEWHFKYKKDAVMFALRWS